MRLGTLVRQRPRSRRGPTWPAPHPARLRLGGALGPNEAPHHRVPACVHRAPGRRCGQPRGSRSEPWHLEVRPGERPARSPAAPAGSAAALRASDCSRTVVSSTSGRMLRSPPATAPRSIVFLSRPRSSGSAVRVAPVRSSGGRARSAAAVAYAPWQRPQRVRRTRAARTAGGRRRCRRRGARQRGAPLSRRCSARGAAAGPAPRGSRRRRATRRSIAMSLGPYSDSPRTTIAVVDPAAGCSGNRSRSSRRGWSGRRRGCLSPCPGHRRPGRDGVPCADPARWAGRCSGVAANSRATAPSCSTIVTIVRRAWS
jgi:hypothetical protein